MQGQDGLKRFVVAPRSPLHVSLDRLNPVSVMRANNNEENENQNKKDIVRKEKNRGISTDIHAHLPQAGFYLAKIGENFTFKKTCFLRVRT